MLLSFLWASHRQNIICKAQLIYKKRRLSRKYQSCPLNKNVLKSSHINWNNLQNIAQLSFYSNPTIYTSSYLQNYWHLWKNCATDSRFKLQKLIRWSHNVGILNDRSQDVHINTQMLNGWRMSEWKVVAAGAKIHSVWRKTQVHIPDTATRYWHMLKWTWHSSLRTDVNPGQIITSVSEQTFFHLISVF